MNTICSNSRKASSQAGLTPGLRLPAAAQSAATHPADLVLKSGKKETVHLRLTDENADYEFLSVTPQK